MVQQILEFKFSKNNNFAKNNSYDFEHKLKLY